MAAIMNPDVADRLARSLTAETAELIPYIPYLLQDLWELGSDPEVIVTLVGRHIEHPSQARFLDLACGKGAVAVRLARAFGAHVTAIDLTADFLSFAAHKAEEYGVEALCDFRLEDINRAVERERDYDCAVYGAVGNVLGNPPETLGKLERTVSAGGFVVIDEAYAREDADDVVRYRNYDYLSHNRWLEIFDRAGFDLIESVPAAEECGAGDAVDAELGLIAARAGELSVRHPGKKALFDAYVESQRSEYHDLQHAVTGVTWLLRKRRAQN